MIETILLQVTQQLPEEAAEITKYDWSSWQGIKNFLLEQIASNQLVQGGLILGILTTIGYYLKDIPLKIWERIKRKLTFEVTVESRDTQFYLAFEDWLRNNFFKSYRNVKAKFNEDFIDKVQHEIDTVEEDDNIPVGESKEDDLLINNKKIDSIENINPIEYHQISDWFFIYYNWFPIKVEKERKQLENASNYTTMFYDVYRFSTFFGKTVLHKLLTEVAFKHRNQKLSQTQKREVAVYVNDLAGWNKLHDFEPKPLESIIQSNKNRIIEDLTKFKNRKQWYKKRAIPYKRGHLYKGPPGNGKTSLALAIANYFNCDCYILNLNEADDASLKSLFQSLKRNSILLIEDVDGMTPSKRKNDDSSDTDMLEGKLNVSLTTLLNCLDGVLYKEGVIAIMTTNHYEKLDPALIRDGRVDLIEHIGNPTLEDIKQYIAIYYNINESEIKINDDYQCSLSMAKVQNICLNNDNYQYAIQQILKQDKDTQIE